MPKNTMSRARVRIRTVRSRDECPNYEATMPPHTHHWSTVYKLPLMKITGFCLLAVKKLTFTCSLMFLMPVSKELKASLDVTNHRTVHASNDLLTQNTSFEDKVTCLLLLSSFHNHCSIRWMRLCLCITFQCTYHVLLL